MANGYGNYLENEVLNADPVKLVSILYRAAIDAAGAARRHLAAGDIRERSRQIVKAWRIVHELMRSLDRQQGGAIGRDLAELYGYIQQRLLDANAQQADAPLAEVQELLSTLLEGWSTIPAPQAAPAPVYESVSCAY